MDEAGKKQVLRAAVPTDGEHADTISEEAEVTTQALARPAQKGRRSQTRQRATTRRAEWNCT